LPFLIPKFTVVSNVFGKQFSNIHRNLGSLIFDFTLAIVFSTALEVNLRFSGAGRFDVYTRCCGVSNNDDVAHAGFTAKAASPIPVFLRKFLRVVI
jgi:hypothetical protein